MRSRILVGFSCLILVLAGNTGSEQARAAAQGHPGSYYVALGDSLAYGITAEGVAADPQCHSAAAPGYVCVFYRFLQQIQPGITLKNLSQPGLDSCELVHGYGNGSPCTHPLGVSSFPSPLDATVALVRGHPGQVSPITIDIGANDLLPLAAVAAKDPFQALSRVPAALKNLTANLDVALSTLHSAAPGAKIMISTQYNPLVGLGSPPLPAGVPEAVQAATDGLNGVIRAEATKRGVQLVDVAATFAAHPGGAATLTYLPSTLATGSLAHINPHATAEGYRLWGEDLIQASGYSLTLTAHLRKTQVARGKRDRVIGRTSPGASLTITVRHPHAKARMRLARARTDGTFSFSFRAGSRAGKGWVRVCAANPATHQSTCSARLRYTVH